MTDPRGLTRCPDCNALDTADRRANCNLHPCPLRGLRRPPAVKGAPMAPIRYGDSAAKRLGNWLFDLFGGKR